MVDATVHVILFAALYFEVLLLISFIEKYPSVRSQASGARAHLPSVSIIVPCYNEERTIAGTVRSLLALSYPRNKLEIIVVDDGSTDGTAATARRFEKYPNVTVLQKENGGKHTALNFALERTSSELIGCLDADSYVSPHALKEIVPYFDNSATMAVTPALKVYRPRNIIELVQKAEYGLSVFIRRVFGFLNAQFVTPGPFSIFRRRVFSLIGPFRYAHNTEDLEMCLRLQSRHYTVQNAHRAYVYTIVPRTFRQLFRQRVRWTYGFIKNAADYRHLFFRPSYGCLGTVVLPTAALSIIGALYFSGLILIRWALAAWEKMVEIKIVGVFPYSFAPPELFFVNTDTLLLLMLTIITITFIILLIGKWLAAEKRLVGIDSLLFLVLYGFMAPLWLGVSVINAVLSREGNWKAEHER